MQMMPESAKRAAASPTRRMFSVRSSGEKPRLALRPRRTLRSEEHTSELQSLMRISYAVFCLKKKKKTTKSKYEIKHKKHPKHTTAHKKIITRCTNSNIE